MIIEIPTKGVILRIPKSLHTLHIQFLPKPSPWNDLEFDEGQFLFAFELGIDTKGNLHSDNQFELPDPIELEVKFTERQLKCAQNDPNNLFLAIKYGDNWIKKDNYKLGDYNDGPWRGSHIVTINNWGDPMVAWGP